MLLAVRARARPLQVLHATRRPAPRASVEPVLLAAWVPAHLPWDRSKVFFKTHRPIPPNKTSLEAVLLAARLRQGGLETSLASHRFTKASKRGLKKGRGKVNPSVISGRSRIGLLPHIGQPAHMAHRGFHEDAVRAVSAYPFPISVLRP